MRLGETIFGELIIAGSLILLFSVIDVVVYFILRWISTRLTLRFENQLGQYAIGPIQTPVLLFIFLQGVFLATTVLSGLEGQSKQIENAWAIMAIVMVIWFLTKGSNSFLYWYVRFVAPKTSTRLDEKLVPALRRLLILGIYVVGGMLIVEKLGYTISPLIAGLGIGGLAVALAFQPALANLFAGTYIVSDNAIHIGDYIEMESGLSGYVAEMGWRSTKIRTVFNNLVIIPNSRLADSIITNYYAPTSDMWVRVTGGVSYDSDLSHVERVALEVVHEVILELPGAVTDSEPRFGFDNFGDSNIDFWFFVQATDRIGTFAVKSELIKRLHHRFNEEGIEINYPVRKLVFPTEDRVVSSVEPAMLDKENTAPDEEHREAS